MVYIFDDDRIICNLPINGIYVASAVGPTNHISGAFQDSIAFEDVPGKLQWHLICWIPPAVWTREDSSCPKGLWGSF